MGFTEAQSIEVARKLFASGVTIGATSVVEGFFGNRYARPTGGSGFVATKEGWIVTNYHVVAEALPNGLQVQFLNEDKARAARLIGKDEQHDLAILKVEGRVSVPHLKFGNSRKVFPGQSIRLFGSPFLSGSALRQGVVSGYRELVDSDTGKITNSLIQTDAAINPGDSGGPMVDSRGDVIGINQMIISRSGGSHGVNFAIPIEYAEALIRETRKAIRKKK